MKGAGSSGDEAITFLPSFMASMRVLESVKFTTNKMEKLI